MQTRSRSRKQNAVIGESMCKRTVPGIPAYSASPRAAPSGQSPAGVSAPVLWVPSSAPGIPSTHRSIRSSPERVSNVEVTATPQAPIYRECDNDNRTSVSMKSTKSAATIVAQKLAAEARYHQRKLDRERKLAQELAQRESEVEQLLLQAEIAAIEASQSSAGRGSHASSCVLSEDRTDEWVASVNTEVNNPVMPDTALRSDNFENIIKALSDTASAVKALASAQSKPKVLQNINLPFFQGNALEWLQFKRIFNDTKTFYSPVENICRLQMALRGAAKEAVASLLASSDDADFIVQTLEHRFARPEIIVQQEVFILKNLPKLSIDLKELPTLSTRVRNSVATIRALNHLDYLSSPELYQAILAKLNPFFKSRWYDFAERNNQSRPRLEIMSEFLSTELDKHIKFGSPLDSAICQTHLQSKNFPNRVNVFATSSDDKQTDCLYCKCQHSIKVCKDFKKLSVDDRWNWVRQTKVCYKCLKGNKHVWKLCKVKPCGVNGCTLRHSSLLHRDTSLTLPLNTTCTINTQNASINTSADNEVSAVRSNDNNLTSTAVTSEVVNASNTSAVSRQCQTFLKVVPVTVSGPAGSYDSYALLDDGSTATVIDSKIASLIGATGPSDRIRVNGIGGMSRDVEVSYVSFYIKGKYMQDKYLITNAKAMDGLSLHTQNIKASDLFNYSHLADLVDELSYSNATPTILIGAEDWHLSVSRETRSGSRSEPLACLTLLGWAVYGAASSRTKQVEFVNHTSCVCDVDNNESLEFFVKEQYRLDSLGIAERNIINKLDQRAIDILKSTARRLPSGRFEVGLPWRDDISYIPDSYFQALSRLKSLEKTMSKNKQFSDSYITYMNDIVSKGYAEECIPSSYHDNNLFKSKLPLCPPRWYSPHFGVYHPQKQKLRVVHDAAAKTFGVSLNSLLLPGPDLLQPLLGLLFRFREGHVALIADIKEMFPQVRIREKDRDALRFLWRAGDHNSTVKEFRMTSVIFGASPSPFLAQFVKNENAKEFQNIYPEAVEAILHDHYMDDYVGSHDNVATAAKVASEIVLIHKAACFEMRGWISNLDEALSLIPVQLKAIQPSEVELCSSQNKVRALGVAWNPKSDVLGFRTGLSDEITKNFTKRTLLSHLMRVYDPLGLLGPIVIKGRILFQSLWRTNVDWDTPLSSDMADKWHEWFKELLTIKDLHIPRWYLNGFEFKNVKVRELHTFSDASELAYSCVAYWRFVFFDGTVKVALISSKVRVSPLKSVSIPRLELQAALIATRLALCIKDSHRQKPSSCFFWTDSMTVLNWLRSDTRTFKPFVAHRLGEILENTNVKDWKWIPTDLNVADDATRARSVSLDSKSRWFLGPSFLLHPPEKWPLEPSNLPTDTTSFQNELKTKPPALLQLSILDNSCFRAPVVTDFTHFSEWTRLIRATARAHQAASVFRFLLFRKQGPNSKACNIRKNIAVTNHPSSICNPSSCSSQTLIERFRMLPPLSVEQMKVAENHVLRQSQLDSFETDIKSILESSPISKKSRLLKLSPVIGDDHLLRLAGRIRVVQDVNQSAKTPLILDGRHQVTRLLVQHFHKRLAHANNETVINELRQAYWIIHLRSTVRSVSSKCLFCRTRKGQPLSPPTGDLPAERLGHHKRPFTFTGLDYFGPIEVAVGRRREKRWVALYTCMTSRAIHLELVNSLSADSAIMSLRRFIARRGTPNTIFSDNGTCFVGAARQLKQLYDNEVEEYAVNRGIQWKFIPPAAPSFGGCWERLVRSVKAALRVTLTEKVPKEEILLTLLMEVEAIVNSRPLTYVSVDPNDDETLTPFHFILGTSSNMLAPTLCDTDLLGRCDWKKALRLADHFWSRWVREVLPDLQPRATNNGPTEYSLEVGDVVLLVDHTLPRGVWPRGRIVALHPGKDGIVRVIDLATKGGILRRPVKKIIKLLSLTISSAD